MDATTILFMVIAIIAGAYFVGLFVHAEEPDSPGVKTSPPPRGDKTKASEAGTTPPQPAAVSTQGDTPQGSSTNAAPSDDKGALEDDFDLVEDTAQVAREMEEDAANSEAADDIANKEEPATVTEEVETEQDGESLAEPEASAGEEHSTSPFASPVVEKEEGDTSAAPAHVADPDDDHETLGREKQEEGEEASPSSQSVLKKKSKRRGHV